MLKQINLRPIIAALGTSFILSMAVNPIVNAGENPVSYSAGTSSQSEPNKTTVPYVDLNLENEEAVQVLYRRLVRASKDVCGFKPIGFMRVEPGKQCYLETLADAVEKTDNVDLIRIHAG